MIKLQNYITKVLSSQELPSNSHSSVPIKNNNTPIIRRFTGLCAIKKDEPLDCTPIKEVIDDPVTFFSKKTVVSHRRLLDYLISLKSKHTHVYPTRASIAQTIGVSERQVTRLIKDLKDWGLLVTEQRFKLSSHYHLSSFLFKSEIMQSLGHFIKSFRVLSLSLLLPFHAISSDVHQFSKKKNMYLFKLLSSSYCKRDKLASDGKNNKKEGSVKQFKRSFVPNDPVGATIRGLTKKYRLTRSDQIRLAACSDDAIKEADQAFDCAKSVDDSFGFLMGLSMKFTIRNGSEPDWEYMYALAEEYKVNIAGVHKPISKEELMKEVKVGYESNNAQPTYRERRHSASAPYRPLNSSFIKKEEKDSSRTWISENKTEKLAVKPKEWHGFTEPNKPKPTLDQSIEKLFGQIINGKKEVLSYFKFIPKEAKIEIAKIISHYPQYDTMEIRNALIV